METDLLAQSIDQKHRVLVQLHELSRRQLDLAGEKGDIAQLLTVLAAKQTLIGELTEIEKRLDPFRNQDPQSRRWRNESDRQRCAQTVLRCQSLIDEIMQLEKQGEADLTQRRDTTAARLQASSGAARARRAYCPQKAATTSQLDLTSEQ